MRTEARLDFGKHYGRTLGEVIAVDPDWLFENFSSERFRTFLHRHRLRARIGLALPEQAKFASVSADDRVFQ